MPGHDVHTTINPSIERAAIAAEAGRYAGIVAMDPRTGAILGVAGVGFSALQPPGSTMKIVTTTGALDAKVAKPTDTYAAGGARPTSAATRSTTPAARSAAARW